MGDWHSAKFGSKDDVVIENDLTFTSRRSPFLCRKGCVASSQPLASSVGLDLLRKGANAADVAVAVAASLAVLEPCSTGVGGDMFCLFYDASTKKVSAINGSGRSPQSLTNDVMKRDVSDGKGGVSEADFRFSQHAVTVPGAVQGWEDLLKRHGSGSWNLSNLLEPAAQLAEEGFPVTPVTAHHWKASMYQIKNWFSGTGDEELPLTVDGKNSPEAGQIFRNPGMARVLRSVGEKGAKDGFYRSDIGQAIVDVVQSHGGLLTMKDLDKHESIFPDPMCASYRDVRMWQVPPNGQGVAALVALVGLQHLEEYGMCPKLSSENIGSAAAYHAQMEMMRLGFADARAYVSCPGTCPVSNEWLVSKDRVGNRAQTLFNPEKAQIHGQPLPSSCTVSFQVVDPQGNAVSFVNSNFTGFGSGISPPGCGFTLQNRGSGFTVNDPDHPNAVGGGKRPSHTIIPCILTYEDTNELYATLTNMGGNMQPQGHLQLTVDMVAAGLDPQAAIDKPRFCIPDGKQTGAMFLEEGVPSKVIDELKALGHDLESNVSGHRRSLFGRAQIIKRDRMTGTLWAGSDGRADGCAMGF